MTTTTLVTGTALTAARNVQAEAGRRMLRPGQLAEAIGMTKQALSRRWTGQIPWTIPELDTVASVLGVDVRELVTERVGATSSED